MSLFYKDLIHAHYWELRSGQQTAAVFWIPSKTDLVIIESMSSSREAAGALVACQDFDMEVWLSFTLHGNRKNTLPSGESLSDAIDAIFHFDFQALMINCSATNQVTEALRIISQKTNLPFGGYANPERIVQFGESKGVDTDPEASRKSNAVSLDIPQYITEVKQWLELGATIIGGCCRTKPEHIKRINQLVKQYGQTA